MLAKLQLKTADILNHVNGVRRQNYGELKNTGSDTSINIFTNFSLQWQSRTTECLCLNSATRYFHDKKYTAYYCFSATLSFSVNNLILNSYAKWALFSEPVTYDYVHFIVQCMYYSFVPFHDNNRWMNGHQGSSG